LETGYGVWRRLAGGTVEAAPFFPSCWLVVARSSGGDYGLGASTPATTIVQRSLHVRLVAR